MSIAMLQPDDNDVDLKVTKKVTDQRMTSRLETENIHAQGYETDMRMLNVLQRQGPDRYDRLLRTTDAENLSNRFTSNIGGDATRGTAVP